MVDIRLSYEPNQFGEDATLLPDKSMVVKDPVTGTPILIELQGEINGIGFKGNGNSNDENEDVQQLGLLAYESVSGIDNVPILRICNHRLEGKKVSLKKPLAIIHRKVLDEISSNHGVTPSSSLSSLNSYDNSKSLDAPLSESNTSFVIEAVVKEKIIFKDRPLHVTTDEYRGISKFAKLK